MPTYHSTARIPKRWMQTSSLNSQWVAFDYAILCLVSAVQEQYYRYPPTISLLLNYFEALVVKSRRMRWAGHVARMGEERGVYRVLVGKPEGRRPLGRPRRRWMDNISRISSRWDVGIWTGLGWPRIETGGRRLWVRQWTFGLSTE